MRILVASLLLVAASAAADPAVPPDAAHMHADDCAKARAAHRDCVLNMEGVAVDGNKPGGDGIATNVLRFTREQSLVHVRLDFLEQIVKTAETL